MALKRAVSVLYRSDRIFSDSSLNPSAVQGTRPYARLNGWVQKSHRCGTFTFLHISDGLSTKHVQVVVPRKSCPTIPVGSAVSVAGRWQENIGEKQDVELLADACEVLAVDEEVNISRGTHLCRQTTYERLCIFVHVHQRSQLYFGCGRGYSSKRTNILRVAAMFTLTPL